MDQPVTHSISHGSTTIKGISFILTCVATLMILNYAHNSPRRFKSTDYANGNIVWVSSPYLSAVLTTDHSQTLSITKMTSLFIQQLPLVAATLEAFRLREIAFAQIGGLYGP